MINNNIQEAYCSFEVSELLKDKGFWVQTYEKCWVKTLDDNIIYNGSDEEHDRAEQWIMHPTHSVAVEWIRLNFGIWITVEGDCYGEEWYSRLSVVSKGLWNNLDTRHEVLSATKKFNNIHKTPDGATEAALLFTLENLIP